MPFTASHPAAILPFLGLPLSASALVCGSISPDVPYFLPGRPGWETHTIGMLLGVDLLLGLAVWITWHGLLAKPAVAASPRALQARLDVADVRHGLRSRLRTGRDIITVLISIWVGAGTHVLWDEFTHSGRLGTANVAWLREDQLGIAGFRWAQYASGLFGGLILLIWLTHWWRRTLPAIDTEPASVGFAVWIAIGGLGLTSGSTAAAQAGAWRAAIFDAVTIGGSVSGMSAFAFALAWHLQQRKGSG